MSARSNLPPAGVAGPGVGRRLWSATTAFAGNAGYRKLVIQVRGSNAAAQAFYRRLGFQDCGRLSGQVVIDGLEDDEVLMECFIEPRSAVRRTEHRRREADANQIAVVVRVDAVGHPDVLARLAVLREHRVPQIDEGQTLFGRDPRLDQRVGGLALRRRPTGRGPA